MALAKGAAHSQIPPKLMNKVSKVLRLGGFVCVERTAGDDRLGDLASAVRLLRRFVPLPVG